MGEQSRAIQKLNRELEKVKTGVRNCVRTVVKRFSGHKLDEDDFDKLFTKLGL